MAIIEKTLPPRIGQLEPSEWSEETRAALSRWQPPMNFHKTMAHHPRTLSQWIGFGEHILFENLLGPRHREMVILRVAANMSCAYEWGAHRAFTLREGWMTPEEIDRLAFPIDERNWTAHEVALLTAVDELQKNGEIGQASWDILSANFTPAHFIDLIYLVGEFAMVGMAMKSFRIAMEDGFVPLPAR